MLMYSNAMSYNHATKSLFQNRPLSEVFTKTERKWGSPNDVGTLRHCKGTLSSGIHALEESNLQFQGERDGLLLHTGVAFIWVFVALCPYLYLCSYLPGLTLHLSILL